jgi:formylglycine-generating enzyme required for sulfatase activity
VLSGARPALVAAASAILSSGSASQSGATSSAGKTSSPEKAKTKKNPQDGLPYAWIPAGSFVMGCSPGDEQCFSEEKPAHPVTISNGFWIGQTEVTVEAYERFAGIAEDRVQSPSNSTTGDPDNFQALAIVNVTWDEANDFCKWTGGRLPTEAEWEYAARAGNTAARYAELDEIAWFDKNSANTVHAVGQKRANQFGLFDTLGNAWEWVSDFYDGTYYTRSPQNDPTGPPTGRMHGLRGGSWLNNPKLLRVSDRGRSAPELRFNYFGLRCVLTADSQ